MIKQDTSENQVKIVYLALGSNLGNKRLNIEAAKFRIQNTKIKILKCSSLYETNSWPDPKKPKFLNMVIKINTTLSPFKLLEICQSIERNLGRKRSKKNEPRECDIDIIDYNQLILTGKNKYKLILPHKSMNIRNFVLLPLFEVSKNWKHPKNKANIVNLMNSLNIKDLSCIKQI